jgi:hypothetical protein
MTKTCSKSIRATCERHPGYLPSPPGAYLVRACTEWSTDPLTAACSWVWRAKPVYRYRFDAVPNHAAHSSCKSWCLSRGIVQSSLFYWRGLGTFLSYQVLSKSLAGTGPVCWTSKVPRLIETRVLRDVLGMFWLGWPLAGSTSAFGLSRAVGRSDRLPLWKTLVF